MKEYQKYRWFFTSSKKLVIGGKSAEQNEALLNELRQEKKDFLVMHTAEPGSPFSIIIADIKLVKTEDIEECAIFTACFSKAWKQNKKTVEIHIFHLSQLYKKGEMKTGTWGVKGKIEKITARLSLVLTKQKSRLRAVPEKSANSCLLKITPGKVDKQLMLSKLERLLPEFSREEILSALPAGGIAIK